MSGWIKLHRVMESWEWYTAPNHVFVFVHLLMKANHEAGSWRGIKYERGDVLTSLDKLSIATGLTKQNIRTILKNLESTGETMRKPTRGLTHLSICKYDTYQDKEFQANTETNTELTPIQHEPNTSLTPNNNNKELKELKEKQPAKPVDDKYLKFCEHYYKKLIEASEAGYIGTIKSNTKWNGKAWTDSIRLLETSDGIPWSKITELASWYFTTNIKGNYRYQALSMASFREKFSAMETTMLKGDNSQPEQGLSLAERMEQRR